MTSPTRSLPKSPPSAAPVIRFLLDRISEDEVELERAARLDSRSGAQTMPPSGVGSVEQLRRSLIAKRHAIGDLQQLAVLRDLPIEAPVRRASVAALCAMTAPYAGHRQFRPEWARQDHGAVADPRDGLPHRID